MCGNKGLKARHQQRRATPYEMAHAPTRSPNGAQSILLSTVNQNIMAQSLSKVYVHITFSTKNRYPFIDNQIKEELWAYLGGVCKALECNPVRVGGHSDHDNQEEHHRKRTFQEELLAFLRKYDVEYDERYLWE
jgi:hypothetical protein